jgi:hypothetical protein
VAISPVSRTGQTRRLRRDLTAMIRRAADRAARLQARIELDSGVRLDDEGWLYLRRRRNREATIVFTAADELDLFLHFFASGLYVEPDPDQVRQNFPWLGEPTTAERRRRKEQPLAYITSRTDALDRWHAGELVRRRGDAVDDLDGDPPRKPVMTPSPMSDLVDALRDRGDHAWLSIGATLISGSSAAQSKLSRIPHELLDNPFGDGRGRSYAIPFATSRSYGWLLVWATRPPTEPHVVFESRMRDYLRAKKHQTGLVPGVAFCYDETTRELFDVYYDGHIGELEPELAARARLALRPAGDMDSWPHPATKGRSANKRVGRRRRV